MKNDLAHIRAGLMRGVGLGLGLIGTTLLAVSVNGVLHTFTRGDLISSSKLNTNFATLRTAIESTREPPIGSIIAWHKDLGTGAVPALPEGWLECDGQTVMDEASPLDGVVLPNLNGDGRFLRGSSSSGANQAAQFAQHTHRNNMVVRTYHSPDVFTDLNTGSTPTGVRPGIEQFYHTFNTINPNVGFAGGAETRPINMSVVWIVRVK